MRIVADFVRSSAVLFSMGLACCIGFRPVAAQDWDGSDGAALCESVCQKPDETWRTIPWQTDLLAAQRVAVAESKLLFIWAMDGHPLGCT